MIGFPIVAFLIVLGETPFAVLIGIVCVVALCEYFRLTFNPGGSTISGLFLLLGLISGAGIIWAASRGEWSGIVMILSANLILSGLFSLSQFKSDPHAIWNLFIQILGIIYIPVSFSFLVFLRNGPEGMVWLFFLVCVIFAGDTGAFYAGSYYGKHKLCPSVSPGKTIEGAIGGLGANLIIGLIIKAIFLPAASWTGITVVIIVIGIAGQAGDLFESQLKRRSKIKDSGTILPGHGGLLDRIDALLFAAPLIYIFKALILTP